MVPTEDTICGLIEFDPSEARIVWQSRCAGDDTLQATLVSLAQDRMHEIAASDDGDVEWDEAELLADFAVLEQELLLVYRRLKSR
jgi:hypothetical protein